MRRHLRFQAKCRPARAGATLVEVLMSLLILAIGVVPIFTLFPISLLSSIKANQLTTARLFADQIAATARARPELILGATSWVSGASYPSPANPTLPTLIIPSKNSTSSSVSYFYANLSGTSGVVEPNWSATLADGSMIWQRRTLPTTRNDFSTFISTKYVVDPYGASYADANLKNDFGNINLVTAPNGERVLRINGGITSELQAILANFTSPDTWTTQATVVPSSVNTLDLFPTSTPDGIADTCELIFPGSVDVSSYTPQLATTDPPLARVVAISPDGRRSESGIVTANTTAKLQVNSRLLANSTTPMDITSAIGQVRLETFERRYSWLGAIQRFAGRTHVQCAIFFNRSFRANDEQLYTYNPTSIDTLTVTWSGTDPEPYIVEGGYAFDAGTVSFHRIVDASKTPGTATIVVSPPLDQSSSIHRMIFMPGIIWVYEFDI